jgi:hypothetical protein
MRPIFTVHAGEFLVGQHLESFKNRNVWVPTKEHDVDLLVTDKAQEVFFGPTAPAHELNVPLRGRPSQSQKSLCWHR